MVAWHMHWTHWISIIPNTSPMQYNAAVAFLVSGIGVIGFALNWPRVTKTCGTIAMLIGGLSFLETVSQLDLYIDQLLFTPYYYHKVSHIGRVPPNSALCFLAVGAALWISFSKIKEPIRPFIINFLGTSAFGIAFVALFGYIMDWEAGYSWIKLTHMAFNTVIGVIVLSSAICLMSLVPWAETKYLVKQWLPVYVAYNLLLVVALLLWARVNVREEGHIEEIAKAHSGQISAVIENTVFRAMTNLDKLAENELLWNEKNENEWQTTTSDYLNSVPGAIELIWIGVDNEVVMANPVNGLNINLILPIFLENYQKNGNFLMHLSQKEKMPDYILLASNINSNGVDQGTALLVVDAMAFFERIFKGQVDPEYSISLYEKNAPIYKKGNQMETLNKELSTTTNLSFYGSQWVLETWPSQSSLDAHKLSVSLLIMIYGLTQQFVTALSIYLTRVTKQRADESRRSQIFLQSIIDGSTTPIYVKGVDDRYIVVNNAFNKLFRLDKDKVIGHKDKELLPNKTSQLFRHLDKEAIDKKTTTSTEGKLGLENSDQIFISERFPIYDIDQKVVAVCGIATDVTEIKKSQHELSESFKKLEAINVQLEKAKQNAENANIAKSAFLATMSHEIRTPLNGIVGITYLLQNTQLNDKQEKYLNRIILSAQVLTELINDILDFSKIEANELKLEYITTDLYQLCRDVLELLAPRANEKKVEIGAYLDIGYPCNVFIDQVRLRQIITNFMGNAIKFTSEGFILLKVSSKEVESNMSLLHFEVVDSGIGIPLDKQDKIFDKFSQADSTITRKFGGTGLGLSICRQLCKMMGGKIGVESEPGEGSKFWFDIPVKIDKEANQLSTKTIQSGKLVGSKALILHREMMQKTIIEDYTRLWEMEAQSTTQYEEGIEVLNNQNFDYAIIDYHLKGVKREGMEKIVQIAKNKSITIILLAPFEEQGYLEEFLKEGVRFVSTPIDYIELYTELTKESEYCKSISG